MLRAPFHGIFIYAGNQTATSKPTDIIRPYEMRHTHHFPLCYRQTNNRAVRRTKAIRTALISNLARPFLSGQVHRNTLVRHDMSSIIITSNRNRTS